MTQWFKSKGDNESPYGEVIYNFDTAKNEWLHELLEEYAALNKSSIIDGIISESDFNHDKLPEDTKNTIINRAKHRNESERTAVCKCVKWCMGPDSLKDGIECQKIDIWQTAR